MECPIAIDFYCGLGGWAEGFLAEEYEVIGFDNVRHDYGTGGYPGQLVLQDVRTVHGAQFASLGDRLRCFVASPPCTEYSYMAMPWKRAKQIARALRGKDEFPAGYKGSRSIEELNLLFNECFRIQREASEAMGRHIPTVVENVKGAQPWVGRAPWNFGSFYLWGDVPALMPMIHKRRMKYGADCSPRKWADREIQCLNDGKLGSREHDYSSGESENNGEAIACSGGDGVKSGGRDWSRYAKTGEVSPHWRIQGLKGPETEWHPNGTQASNRMVATDEFKLGGDWFNGYRKGQGPRNHASRSQARARASAEIAKIPFPLAQHIAKIFKQQIHLQETNRG